MGWAFGQPSRTSPWNSEELLREELFSVERLEQHGRSLAAAQPVSEKRLRGRSLTARLAENARVLLAAYRDIAAAVHAGRPITPAAEWLLDNYHVIEEQVREIRVDLPPGFSRELPKFADGPFAGSPRVFSLALAYVAHTDSRFDPETLRRFVSAYQSVQPLTIGELWAVAYPAARRAGGNQAARGAPHRQQPHRTSGSRCDCRPAAGREWPDGRP